MSNDKIQKKTDAHISKKAKELDIYQDAQRLRDTIQLALYTAQLDTLHPTTKSTAECLIKEIDEALEDWTAQTKGNTSVTESKIGFTKTTEISWLSVIEQRINDQLVERCQSIVNKHENKLMIDPGFWEQVKAAFNSFFRSCGARDVLPVKPSAIAIKAQDELTNEVKADDTIQSIKNYKTGPH